VNREKFELQTTIVELPLAERFTIATETWEAATSVFVLLRYGDETGVGEVQPSGRWEESPESVRAALDSLDLSDLRGPFDLEGVARLLPAGATRCALDMAMHDLAARHAGVSVKELLGLQGRPTAPTTLTIPIGDVDTMVARARKLADYPKIKVKVGFDGDVEAVGALRAVFDGDIRIDANEGWSEEEAIQRLGELERYGIELCEQPIARHQHEALARVTASTSIPIFADEDAGSAEEIASLRGVVDGVNLKLRKSGGPREVFRAAAAARASGLGLMLGCDLESGVATSAEASLAPLMDYIDLDGPLLLAKDPFPGVRYDGANLVLNDGPGLVGDLHDDVLRLFG
jgi:L-alanine-DL-glutamate epimerase-like enolase superfamily enzyme